MKLSPEQSTSLRRSLTLSAKVAAMTSLRQSEITVFMDHIIAIVTEYGSCMNGKCLVMKYDPSGSCGEKLTELTLKKFVAADTRRLVIGVDLSVVQVSSEEASYTSASDLSEDGPSLVMSCSEVLLLVYCAGKVLHDISLRDCSPPAPTTLWRHRPWWELIDSLKDHFEHCVKMEQLFPYWAKKSTRLLSAGTHGTELMFHAPLFWWCRHFLSEIVDVHGETHGLGQQKTDITIVTPGSGSIVLEVKWLGLNENNTTYDQYRIAEGLVQVGDYLNNQPKHIQGVLVLYDARSEEAHRDESDFDRTLKHDKCEEPVLLFLPSETASGTGVRVVKSLKRAAKKAPAKRASAKKSGT